MIEQNPNDDVLRRNVKRELACKLTTDDELRISKTMVMKKRELRQLEGDLAVEKKKRQDQIDDLEDEVTRMESDLDRGAEDRTVPCNDVFRRGDDGTGWIHTIRLDTHEVVERKAASAHETQRYLPNVDVEANGKTSVLDDARAQQRAEEQKSATPANDVPDDDEDDDGDDEDSEEATNGSPKKPKPGEVRRGPEKFDAVMLEDGRCALRFEGGNACSLELGHPGLHKSATHSWKARRPKPPEATAVDGGES